MKKKRARIGDLVYIPEFRSTGLIVTWVRTGGPLDTIWEVLLDDGLIDVVFESDMEIVNEKR